MYLLVTTYPNKGRDLKRFIMGLVKSGLAGCVQRINYVKSYYIRQGETKQEEEKILLIKCAAEQKTKIEEYFKKNHPYDIPEMLRMKPDDVNEAYAAWIQERHILSPKPPKK